MPPGFDRLQYASTGEDPGNEDLNCIDKRIILCKEGSSETTLSGCDSRPSCLDVTMDPIQRSCYASCKDYSERSVPLWRSVGHAPKN